MSAKPNEQLRALQAKWRTKQGFGLPDEILMSCADAIEAQAKEKP